MKKISCLLLLAFLFLLSSCSTVKSVVLPQWINHPSILNGQIGFVGEGSGSSVSEARTASYRDILGKMSTEIGYDLYNLYYREFSANKSIDALGLAVTEEYSYETNGVFFHYVYIVTEEAAFYAARSPEYVALLDREERIRVLLSQAIEEYKANRDVGAAEKVLSALLVSLEGDVSEEDYQPEALVGKAIEYLGRIRVKSVKNRRQAGATDSLTFRLVRNKGLVRPVVEEALVTCEYQSIKSDFSLGTSSLLGRSDRYGRFVFSWANPYAVRKGELKVSVKLDEELLHQIVLHGGQDLLVPVNRIIEDNSFVFAYERNVVLEKGSIVVAVAEYGFDGRAHSGTLLETSIREALRKADVDVPEILTVYQEESSEIEEDLLSLYADTEWILLCRTGVSERTQVGNVYYSKAEGQMVLLNTVLGTREEISNIYFAASGASEKAADEATLQTVAEITAGLVLSKF